MRKSSHLRNLITFTRASQVRSSPISIKPLVLARKCLIKHDSNYFSSPPSLPSFRPIVPFCRLSLANYKFSWLDLHTHRASERRCLFFTYLFILLDCEYLLVEIFSFAFLSSRVTQTIAQILHRPSDFFPRNFTTTILSVKFVVVIITM